MLDHTSFSIGQGEHVLLVGRSGAGKSMLVRLICGQENADSGRVIVAGKIVRIPQDPYLLLIVIHDRRGDQMINIDIKSLISGILVCFITVISSTYILLKTGSGTVIDTVMLSIICLCIIRGFRRESVLLSDVFARSAVSAVTTIITYIGVLYIFGSPLSITQIIYLGFIIIVSGILGILFYSVYEELLMDQDRYKFPQLKPRIELLKSVGTDIGRNVKMSISFIAASLYSLAINVFHIFPDAIKINDMIVLDNSLVLISTGYFVGYKTYLKMGIGFLYSFMIYIVFRTHSFSENILNPYVYSVVLGFSLMQGILTAWHTIKISKISKLKWNFRSLAGIVLIMLFYMIFASKHLIGITQFPFWIFLIIVPAAIILSTSTLVGIAETGFWVSSLEDILPIFLIMMMQSADLFSIILIVSGLTAFEMCGIYYILNKKVSRQFHVQDRLIKQYSILGVIFTSIVGILIFVAISNVVKIGTNSLPAPGSQVFGMTLTGLIESIRTLQLPTFINLKILFISCVICYILNKTKLNPMTIISGIMLPFGTYLVIGTGAVLSYICQKRKEDQGIIFSGLSIGDGLISSILIMLKAFLR